MDPFEEYKKAFDEARQACLEKNFRVAAHKCWKATHLAPAGVWTKYRLQWIQCYVYFLEGLIIVPTTKDYNRLETHILNNEDEPNIFRAEAAMCLGCMHFNDKQDYEEAAQYYRLCIDLSDSASPEEKERVEIVMVLDGPGRACPLSQVFDELKANALTALRQVESCAVEDSEVFDRLNERALKFLRKSECEMQVPFGVQDSVRSPWHVYPRSELVPIFGDIPTEQMERRLASGGSTCDNCGVARDSTDRKTLLVCGKCKMAHYCTRECQVGQWKHRGHKKACRKQHDFHPEDIVRCVWGDEIVMLRLKRLVDGADGDGSRKWEAYGVSDGELRLGVVDESNLRHIRPADIV